MLQFLKRGTTIHGTAAHPDPSAGQAGRSHGRVQLPGTVQGIQERFCFAKSAPSAQKVYLVLWFGLPITVGVVDSHLGEEFSTRATSVLKPPFCWA